jgi:hypothetical protein
MYYTLHVTGEDKIFPVLTEVTHHEDVGEVKVQHHAFLKSALDGGELLNIWRNV